MEQHEKAVPFPCPYDQPFLMAMESMSARLHSYHPATCNLLPATRALRPTTAVPPPAGGVRRETTRPFPLDGKVL